MLKKDIIKENEKLKKQLEEIKDRCCYHCISVEKINHINYPDTYDCPVLGLTSVSYNSFHCSFFQKK